MADGTTEIEVISNDVELVAEDTNSDVTLESVLSTGDLNGYTIEKDSNDKLTIYYTNPNDETDHDIVSAGTETTAQNILTVMNQITTDLNNLIGGY